MRIVIIGPAHPYRGGISDTNEALARALMSAGHDVQILNFSRQYPDILFPGKSQYRESQESSQLDIHRMVDSINPFTWLSSAHWIKRVHPDLVIFRFWMPFFGLCYSTIARRLPKGILKIGFCDNIIPHEARASDRWLTGLFIKQMDGFITMSEKVRAELRAFTDKEILHHPHPINDELPAKMDKSEARSFFGLEESDGVLLYFGLIRKYKGLDLLLLALAQAKKNKPNLKLIIAGEFYDDPQIYHRLIEEHGLHDHTILHDRFIADDLLNYYFSAADLLTLTYRSASQSGVTQMGYHYDLPMLVTDVGGLSEYVCHGHTGLVTSTLPADIAEQVELFFDNHMHDTMSKNVQAKKSGYSWDSFANMLTESV